MGGFDDKANAQLSRRGGLQYVSLDMSEEATKHFNDQLAAAKLGSQMANSVCAYRLIKFVWN